MTLDNIQNRGWVVANRCSLSGKEESTDHLLLHSDLTWDFVGFLILLIWGYSGCFLLL